MCSLVSGIYPLEGDAWSRSAHLGPATLAYKSPCAQKPAVLVVGPGGSGPSQGREPWKAAFGPVRFPGLVSGRCWPLLQDGQSQPQPWLRLRAHLCLPHGVHFASWGLLRAHRQGAQAAAQTIPWAFSSLSLQAPRPADSPVGGTPEPGGHQLAAYPLHHADLHYYLL